MPPSLPEPLRLPDHIEILMNQLRQHEDLLLALQPLLNLLRAPQSDKEQDMAGRLLGLMTAVEAELDTVRQERGVLKKRMETIENSQRATTQILKRLDARLGDLHQSFMPLVRDPDTVDG